jgi:hypothetical protein
MEELNQTTELNRDEIVDLIRIEERQKYVTSQLDFLNSKFQDLHDVLDGYLTRLINCESNCGTNFEERIHNLEYLTNQQADRWETVTRYIFQAIWIILLTWALSKLNLTAPPFS